MDLTVDKLELLQRWNEAKEHLKQWQQVESDLRDQLVKGLFSAKDDGIETLAIQGGWKLKATKKLTYNLNNKDGLVSAIQGAWPELAQQTLRWNPELSVSAYKKLDDQSKQVFDSCLTIKPGKPTLELVPPAS